MTDFGHGNSLDRAMATQELLSWDVEDFTSTSRSVGDRAQVDAVMGPSSGSVARGYMTQILAHRSQIGTGNACHSQ